MCHALPVSSGSFTAPRISGALLRKTPRQCPPQRVERCVTRATARDADDGLRSFADPRKATGHAVHRYTDKNVVVQRDSRPQGLTFEQICAANLDESLPLVPQRPPGVCHQYPQFHAALFGRGDPTFNYVVDIHEETGRPKPLNAWDLRAKMERERVQDEQRRKWLERTGKWPQEETVIGSPGGDFGWRDDIRLRDKAAMMGEWTLKETWDLITDHGLAADPRDVMVNVEDDDEEADPIAEGFDYSWLNDVEWLDERGFILHAETKRPLRILDGIGPDNGPTRHAAGEFLKYGTVRGSEWWVDV